MAMNNINEANNNMKMLMKLKEYVKRLQRGNLVAKKGHFAVIAEKDGEEKRFILELEYLNDPHFVKLLQQAEDEYGFQQQGVLAVPCRPQELQNILGGGAGGGRRSMRRRSSLNGS